MVVVRTPDGATKSGKKISDTEFFLITCLKVAKPEGDLDFEKVVQDLAPRLKISVGKAR